MLIRRSNLLVVVGDATDAWRHNADAITLSLAGIDTGDVVKEAIAVCGRGGAEIFVRADKAELRRDLERSVSKGLRGVVLPQVDTPAEVAEAAAIITSLERERDIAPGSLQLVVLLATGRAVWDIRSIIAASPRISQIGLNEAGLAKSLGIALDPPIDPFVYARGRVVVGGIGSRVRPIDMG